MDNELNKSIDRYEPPALPAAKIDFFWVMSFHVNQECEQLQQSLRKAALSVSPTSEALLGADGTRAQGKHIAVQLHELRTCPYHAG